MYVFKLLNFGWISFCSTVLAICCCVKHLFLACTIDFLFNLQRRSSDYYHVISCRMSVDFEILIVLSQTVVGRLLLLYSCSVMSDSLRPHGLQHARLPVLHHLPELVQTHVYWVDDAMWPSCPLSSPSPAFSFFQYQGLFWWLKRLVDCYSLKKLLLYFGCQWVMFPVPQGCDTREIPICRELTILGSWG